MKAKVKTKTKAGNLRSRFVDEFMIDRNATEAAIRAGYSKTTAGSQGSRLLKNVEILTEINKRSAEQSQRLRITADRVMQEYEALALLDPLDLFMSDGSFKPLDEIPEVARRAMAGIEIVELFDGRGNNKKHIGYVKKFKFVDKKGALDSIAKILGMMREKVEVSGPNGSQLKIKNMTDEELVEIIAKAKNG